MNTSRSLISRYLVLGLLVGLGIGVPRSWSDAVGLSARLNEENPSVQVSGLKVVPSSLKIIRSSQEIEGTLKFDGNFQRPLWNLLQGKNLIKTDSKGNFKISLPFSSLETEIEFAAVGPLGELETKTYIVEISVDLTP